MTKNYCIIVSNTVTEICTVLMNLNGKCSTQMNDMKTVTAINIKNNIMANWSRMMWQNLVNRAVRMSASGPFGSPFFSAIATVCGN
ncbi:hypothetical protein KIN20_017350 [Parelaphostrongylus tenuis]|uniref:Uncharacterized protein n=1 Tax=Parelaphostrongylus tenuis TaxID=148309 RepID=A0AAD5N0Q7_PARTN|nr:hypothetical protein KIN20_017350 [Parelaphostrongylus tenuis]